MDVRLAEMMERVGVLPEELRTGDLLLRAPVHADVLAVTEACQDPEIGRWTRLPYPYGQADAVAFVERSAIEATERTAQNYVIIDPATGDLLGASGVHHVDEARSTLELGYWVAAAARGRGVASAAARLVALAAIEAGFARVEAEVLVGNDASCRVLTKAGLTHEGTLRSVAADGCGSGAPRIDVHVFSLVAADLCG